jgi:hypothetical protein
LLCSFDLFFLNFDLLFSRKVFEKEVGIRLVGSEWLSILSA